MLNDMYYMQKNERKYMTDEPNKPTPTPEPTTTPPPIVSEGTVLIEEKSDDVQPDDSQAK